MTPWKLQWYFTESTVTITTSVISDVYQAKMTMSSMPWDTIVWGLVGEHWRTLEEHAVKQQR